MTILPLKLNKYHKFIYYFHKKYPKIFVTPLIFKLDLSPLKLYDKLFTINIRISNIFWSKNYFKIKKHI